jgi:tight adherence protein B
VTPLAVGVVSGLAVYVALLPRPSRLAPRGDGARPAAVLWMAGVAAALSLGPLLAVAVALAVCAARVAAARAAAAREARANAAALPALCRAAAAELRAGATPVTALSRAAADAPPGLAAALASVTAAAQLGVPQGAWPAVPGADRLDAVAALWLVAAGAGAGLADGLDRLASALAAEQRRRADLASQLAGPRASAVVLAALPGVGLGLAAALGAEPGRFLRTPAGAACLAVAVLLDAAGVLWVRRITSGAAA